MIEGDTLLRTDISDVARRHAKLRPTQTALVFDGRRTSYADLDMHVEQVANGLLAMGVARQDRIAILDSNSDQFYEIWLGAARAGVVIVPLNARLTASEASQVLNDCKPRVLFLGAAYADMIDEVRGQLDFIEKIIVTGEAFAAWRESQSSSPVSTTTSSDGDDVCIQLYTSGTTGAPKGVQLTTENAIRPFEPAACGAISPWASTSPKDVFLTLLPHGHVAGCGSGLSGLYAGATVLVVRDFVPDALIALVRREQVTMFVMIPMMIRALVGALPAGSQDCNSVRLIMYGAAPMATASLRQALATFPHAEFAQIYGLTETGGPITHLGPNDHRAIAAGNSGLGLSCGRALPEVEIHVVDFDGKILPAGQIGEIVCRSPQVMKGYWNRPEENRAVLRDGWFHTGDVGHIDEDGYVYLHDRKRDMIITGGENVYPAEVENALYSHPGVAEAVVFGVPDEKWGEAVKAAVVLKPGHRSSEAEILTQLKDLLAVFKVPKSIDFLDSLPRNPTGKVLRRVLREPYWQGQERQVA